MFGVDSCDSNQLSKGSGALLHSLMIGGIGTVEGPIIGMLVFYALREMLSDRGTIHLILLGLVAIVIVLVVPKGAWLLVRSRFNVQLFPLGYFVESTSSNKVD